MSKLLLKLTAAFILYKKSKTRSFLPSITDRYLVLGRKEVPTSTVAKFQK